MGAAKWANCYLVIGCSQSIAWSWGVEDHCLLWYGFYDVDDVWNMDRITLNLIVAKNKKGLEEEYYVVGDLIELGNGS